MLHNIQCEKRWHETGSDGVFGKTIECVLCELSNVINHKEMDDRNDGEPDGSPFFVCRQRGRQHSLLSPLDYTIVKRARSYFLSDSST